MSRPIAAVLPHQHPTDSTAVEQLSWRRGGEPVVELFTVRGGGHVVPQPRFRFPRLLGRTTADLDALVRAIAFFGLDKERDKVLAE